MKPICRFVYAVVLTLSALNFAPSLASAQDSAGTFTLNHEVHWQKAIVPAGKYRFTLGTNGEAAILTLQGLADNRPSFLMLAAQIENSGDLKQSQLVVISRADGRFVSAMQLPEYGFTLHFAVPPESAEVAVAHAATAAVVSR